jgi:hypothetical protein
MMKEEKKKNEYKEKKKDKKYVWEKRKNIWVHKIKIKWTPRFSNVH